MIDTQPRKISSKKGVFPGFPAADVCIRAFFGRTFGNFDRKFWENEGFCRVEAGCRSTFEIWDFREILEFSCRKIPGFFRFPVCRRVYAAIFRGVFRGNSGEIFRKISPPNFRKFPEIPENSGKSGKMPPQNFVKKHKKFFFSRAKIVDLRGFFGVFFRKNDKKPILENAGLDGADAGLMRV